MGFLVEDSLHLVTDDDQPKAVNAQITFGCVSSLPCNQYYCGAIFGNSCFSQYQTNLLGTYGRLLKLI